MQKIIIIILIGTFISCSNQSLDEKKSIEYYNLPNQKKDTHLNKKISVFNITKLKLDDSIETSFEGNIHIYNDTIFFNDKNFGYIYQYDSSGKLVSKNVGIGRGPNEVIGLSYFNKTSDSYASIYNGSSYIYKFDKNFKIESKGRADWKQSRSKEEMLTNPIPSLGDIYEFDWDIPNILQPWDKNHIAVAITASHPMFNAYFDTELYYNYSRFLAIINLDTQIVEKIFGRRSPLYLENKNLPNFDHFNYEVLENDVYVNFWIDPYIYILDKKSDTAKTKFGVPGKRMNTNYTTTNTYEGAEKRRALDIEEYGYYTSLKVFEADSLIVRTYSRGRSEETDGLQIYYNQELMSDTDIPKGMIIVGKIGDFLIGKPKSFDRELSLYKIAINYEN